MPNGSIHRDVNNTVLDVLQRGRFANPEVHESIDNWSGCHRPALRFHPMEPANEALVISRCLVATMKDIASRRAASGKGAYRSEVSSVANSRLTGKFVEGMKAATEPRRVLLNAELIYWAWSGRMRHKRHKVLLVSLAHPACPSQKI